MSQDSNHITISDAHLRLDFDSKTNCNECMVWKTRAENCLKTVDAQHIKINQLCTNESIELRTARLLFHDLEIRYEQLQNIRIDPNYIRNLEGKVQSLAVENKELSLENERLFREVRTAHKCVEELKNENDELEQKQKESISPVTARKGLLPMPATEDTAVEKTTIDDESAAQSLIENTPNQFTQRFLFPGNLLEKLKPKSTPNINLRAVERTSTTSITVELKLFGNVCGRLHEIPEIQTAFEKSGNRSPEFSIAITGNLENISKAIRLIARKMMEFNFFPLVDIGRSKPIRSISFDPKKPPKKYQQVFMIMNDRLCKGVAGKECGNLKEWRSKYFVAIHLHYDQNDFGSSGYAMKNCDDCLISITGDGSDIEKVVYEIMCIATIHGKRMNPLEQEKTVKWFPYKGKLGIFNMSETDKKQFESSITNGLKDRVDVRRDPSPNKRTLGKKLLSKDYPQFLDRVPKIKTTPKSKPKQKTKLNVKHRK